MPLTYLDEFTKLVDDNGDLVSLGSIVFTQNPFSDQQFEDPTEISIPLNTDGGVSIPPFWEGEQAISVLDSDGNQVLSANMSQSPPSSIPGDYVWRNDVTGEPLENGKLYFGVVHKNAKTNNDFVVDLNADGQAGTAITLPAEQSLVIEDSFGVQVGSTLRYVAAQVAATECQFTSDTFWTPSPEVGPGSATWDQAEQRWVPTDYDYRISAIGSWNESLGQPSEVVLRLQNAFGFIQSISVRDSDDIGVASETLVNPNGDVELTLPAFWNFSQPTARIGAIRISAIDSSGGSNIIAASIACVDFNA